MFLEYRLSTRKSVIWVSLRSFLPRPSFNNFIWRKRYRKSCQSWVRIVRRDEKSMSWCDLAEGAETKLPSLFSAVIYYAPSPFTSVPFPAFITSDKSDYHIFFLFRKLELFPKRRPSFTITQKSKGAKEANLVLFLFMLFFFFSVNCIVSSRFNYVKFSYCANRFFFTSNDWLVTYLH